MPAFNAENFPNEHRLETIEKLKQPRKRDETINTLVASIPEQRKLLVWKQVKKYEKDMTLLHNKIVELETEIAKLKASQEDASRVLLASVEKERGEE